MVCNSEKKCCSVTDDNTRCTNNAVGTSNHCDQHRSVAKKLYDTYKNICLKAEKFDIDKSTSIQYLTKAYVWLNRAFDARMKHRKYAFVPECYDEGHDFQFILIKQKIELCEAKLAELYKETNMITDMPYNEMIESVKSIKPKAKSKAKSKSNSNSKSKSKSDSDDEIESNISIPNRIYSCRKQRSVISDDFDTYVEKYIQENQMMELRKSILVGYIQKCVLGLRKQDRTDLPIFCSAIYHILRELYYIHYFESDFVPERCNCSNCDNFLAYKIDLFCKCGHCTDEGFLLRMPEDNLKKMYELLLFNKAKVQMVLNSLLYYYHFYGVNIIHLDYELNWDSKINSLVLKQIFVEGQMKRSEMLGLSRLKDKFYMQRMRREYEMMNGDDEYSD